MMILYNIHFRMRIGDHMKPAVKTPLSPPPVKVGIILCVERIEIEGYR